MLSNRSNNQGWASPAYRWARLFIHRHQRKWFRLATILRSHAKLRRWWASVGTHLQTIKRIQQAARATAAHSVEGVGSAHSGTRSEEIDPEQSR